MTLIILGGIAFSVSLLAIGLVVYDLFFAPELSDFIDFGEEDLFSTLPWTEIIEGKV